MASRLILALCGNYDVDRQFVASSYPSKDLEKLENQVRDTNSQTHNVQSGGKPVQID